MKTALIIEDITETRTWLLGLVEAAWPGCAVRSAETLARARAQLAEQTFELALIDLNLPDGNGLDLLREVKRDRPEMLCVVTTIMADDATVVSALSAGADGYLLKENPAGVLTRQLRQISHGVPALSPAIARRIMEHFRRTGPVEVDARLTEREREVLALIGRGLRTSEVAAELGLAETTVAGYIKAIYRKLGISSRAEAAWHATRMGLREG
ncbi:response regulator transcription factor [Jannaschia sp. M317]|uniref:response regulator n=1 Tax=Jannaschia sp. M317 TaxID=2867011 RepID=UPI0021A5B45B|nr:response regulator transcription factor [Jannaschia sp. M317]UWQ16570.1 response regulator transcription factor [Jannaschia sp. M317]